MSAGEGDADHIDLVLVGHAMLIRASVCAALALAGGTVALLVFDWSLREVVLGGAAGAVLWGAAEFMWETRHRLPSGEPAEPPAGATVRSDRMRPRWQTSLWLAAVLPLLFGLTWLVDRWELGAIFVPGQLVGYATAELLGAALVNRWERDRGRRVVTVAKGDERKPRLYVVVKDRGQAPIFH